MLVPPLCLARLLMLVLLLPPPQDCLRLLVALSTLRTRTGGQYSPSTYDVSDLVSAVVFGLPAMRASQMAAACAACAGFEWPLYRSPAWALDCVAQEALRRWGTSPCRRTSLPGVPRLAAHTSLGSSHPPMEAPAPHTGWCPQCKHRTPPWWLHTKTSYPGTPNSVQCAAGIHSSNSFIFL